jgi:transposase
MGNLFWLTDTQMARLQPFFPKSHGKPRVDDRRVLSVGPESTSNWISWRGQRHDHPSNRKRWSLAPWVLAAGRA